MEIRDDGKTVNLFQDLTFGKDKSKKKKIKIKKSFAK